MTYLIIAIIFTAAGSVITYSVMKSSHTKVEQATRQSLAERDRLASRNKELEAQVIDRKVSDAYRNGFNSRNREVADLQREVAILRDQVKLEAALDERAGGPGRQGTSGPKVVNIHGGRG